MLASQFFPISTNTEMELKPLVTTTKYFPVPKKKKRSLADDTMMRPMMSSYEKLYNKDSLIPDGVPAQFFQNTQPAVLSSLPAQFRIPAQSPLDAMTLQRTRSEATERALIGQQETLQHQIDIQGMGTLDQMKKFVSSRSYNFEPELMVRRFGSAQPSVSKISRTLRTAGAPTDKRSLLAELISSSNMAQAYSQYVESERPQTQPQGNLPRVIVTNRQTGESRNVMQPESSGMAEARANTTRHARARQHTTVHSNDDTSQHIRNILNAPEARTNPLFRADTS